MLRLALISCIVLSALMPLAARSQDETAGGQSALLLVPDPAHPWAAAQIGGALGQEVEYFNGPLLDALGAAKTRGAAGVVEIKLETSAAFESGRVVCYAPIGRKLWEEKVMFNLGGGEERIARRFADSLEKKVAGKRCSTR